ncbi:MAG: phosphotransferase family protein [Lachnospiraceae bacterium]|nr:phosphotransferase family protein [Lachnospiraceae bacterium]
MEREIIQADVKRINQILVEVLKSSDYLKIERMGGLTNRTYKVTFPEEQMFVVRIPGEGTEELIIRGDEKISTELACRLGIDAELLYFGPDGTKITKFIPDAMTMSPETMREEKNIKQAAEIFKILHNSNIDTGVSFEVFDMAQGYEKIIIKNGVKMYEDYELVKEKIMQIKNEIDAICNIRKVSCHNDALCENWVTSGMQRMYLIDWEYAGMNDGIWDLADVSIEADYNHVMDELLLTEYLGDIPTETDWKHFLANKLYVDYLWTLWAKTRVPYDGQSMEDWAVQRYERLKRNLIIFDKM